MRFPKNKTINNQYKIVKLIDESRMSSVSLANDIINSNKLVTVKILKNDRISHQVEEIIRFRNEANIVSQFDHPNIVKILAIGEIENQHYIAMEYINGKNLQELLKNNRKFDIKQSV